MQTPPVTTTPQVRALFPTPVFLQVLPNAEEINAQLKPAILERARAVQTTEHSNWGGWQSAWDLTDWGGMAARMVVDRAREVGNKLTSDRRGKPVKIDWEFNAWANVNRPGDSNMTHTHPGSFWSGAYYVDDGYGGSDDPALGGEFLVWDPRGVGPAMCAPNLGFASPGGWSVGASEGIRPQTGMMIMFPSWLTHAVEPYHGSTERISVAFNLWIPHHRLETSTGT